MKKQRFTEEQIIAVLKEQEAGAKVASERKIKATPRLRRADQTRLQQIEFSPPYIWLL